MLSDVKISAVSFGEKTRNIRNMNTVEVLIFNPSDPYIAGHSERGSVTHSSSRQVYFVPGIIYVGLRTADSDEHNCCCSHSSTAQMGVSHTHGVAC